VLCHPAERTRPAAVLQLVAEGQVPLVDDRLPDGRYRLRFPHKTLLLLSPLIGDPVAVYSISYLAELPLEDFLRQYPNARPVSPPLVVRRPAVAPCSVM
jgi:hypothetical protein